MGKRKAAVVPKDESKRDKFIRLAEKRTGNALKYIDMIGALATPAYDYTKADATVIIAALQEAVDRTKGRFDGKAVAASGFTIGK